MTLESQGGHSTTRLLRFKNKFLTDSFYRITESRHQIESMKCRSGEFIHWDPDHRWINMVPAAVTPSLLCVCLIRSYSWCSACAVNFFFFFAARGRPQKDPAALHDYGADDKFMTHQLWVQADVETVNWFCSLNPESEKRGSYPPSANKDISSWSHDNVFSVSLGNFSHKWSNILLNYTWNGITI